jgi:glycosyltransferase involved in cell wall biosynthesis
MRSLINVTQHDIIYLNSFFSFWFSIAVILLMQMGLITEKPIILAPRGEFSPGALEIKLQKKKFYLTFVRLLGLYRNVTWQATSVDEVEHIKKQFANAEVRFAPNLSSLNYDHFQTTRLEKKSGELRMVFLSRICQKKNLLSALRMLEDLEGAIAFDIYGPIEDPSYWLECLEIIRGMPGNVTVSYCGTVDGKGVHSILRRYDLFLFPTQGENFGHVIIESLQAGCPVLISDQTPWHCLRERTAGWEVPISDRKGFEAIIQQVVNMDHLEHSEISIAARNYALEILQDNDGVIRNRELFEDVAYRVTLATE